MDQWEHTLTSENYFTDGWQLTVQNLGQLYMSLFLSLTNFELRRLQFIQNSLCRVVTRSSQYSHITP